MNGSAGPTISREKPGGSALRQAVSDVSAYLLRPFVLLTAIIFCAAAVPLPSLALVVAACPIISLASCVPVAASLKELRKLYTSEVADRVVAHGIQVTHDYATKDGAIPLPATFSMELGERISEQSAGMHARLYSDFPFPWRKDGGPRDDFEREAIRQLRQFPDQPFYRFEDSRVANHCDMQ